MPEKRPDANIGADMKVSNTVVTTTGEPSPGERLRIHQGWVEANVPYLVLSRSNGGRTEPGTVKWVLKTPEANFVLLRVPDNLSETEKESVPDMLAQVLDRETLLVLSAKELSWVLPQLDLSMQARQYWPGPRYEQAFRAEIKEVLGDLPEKGSVEHRAQNLHSTGLTAQITLGFKPVDAGTALTIISRWEIAGYHFIALTGPDDDTEHDFTLSWLCSDRGGDYAIISYPPDITGDDDIKPRIVLRLLNADTVITLSSDELRQVAVTCLHEMERVPRCSTEQAHKMLGDFSSLEERKRRSSRF